MTWQQGLLLGLQVLQQLLPLLLSLLASGQTKAAIDLHAETIKHLTEQGAHPVGIALVQSVKPAA